MAADGDWIVTMQTATGPQGARFAFRTKGKRLRGSCGEMDFSNALLAARTCACAQ